MFKDKRDNLILNTRNDFKSLLINKYEIEKVKANINYNLNESNIYIESLVAKSGKS